MSCVLSICNKRVRLLTACYKRMKYRSLSFPAVLGWQSAKAVIGGDTA